MCFFVISVDVIEIIIQNSSNRHTMFLLSLYDITSEHICNIIYKNDKLQTLTTLMFEDVSIYTHSELRELNLFTHNDWDEEEDDFIVSSVMMQQILEQCPKLTVLRIHSPNDVELSETVVNKWILRSGRHVVFERVEQDFFELFK